MRNGLFVLLMGASAFADVRLPTLFGDHMVLQADTKVAVWGWADPGEDVAVRFDEFTASAKANAEGKWRVELGPIDVRAARTLTIQGKNTITLKDVCVGEVWICSGQSNMQWPVQRSANAKAEIADAKDARLRLFTVQRRVAAQPAEDVRGSWSVCAPETIANFSAVAYFFGRKLRRGTGIPVGLIHTSWGGTPAEAWTRRETLTQHDVLRPIVERWDDLIATWPERQKAHQAKLAEWHTQAEAARKDGKRAPPRPRAAPGPNHPHRAAGLFNAMIAPLTPYAIRGAIWYQGESNAGRAEQYRTLFPTMIRDWRSAWSRGDFPFLFVQLANFRALRAQPGESDWAELRDAQRFALEEPATAMAVTIDIGEARDIHPKNKQDVGLRLALAALRLVHQEDVVPSGPAYTGHTVAEGRVVLRFAHAGGLGARNEDPLRGFAIAGKDRKFRWAHARIERDTVVVWHPRVPEPVAVRYAWADNPICNLVNSAGLPASPFRTDDWPGVTAGRR